MELYSLLILVIAVVVAAIFGVSPVVFVDSAGTWAVGCAVCLLVAIVIAWLATVIQRMAILIDKFGRYVETQELIRLSHRDGP